MIPLQLGASPSIPTLPASVSYRMVTATYTRQFEAFEHSAAVRKDTAYFWANISKVKSVDDIVDDYRLFRFVLSAFGLESQVNAKAFIKKVLTEDWRDPTSVAGKLVDPRFREFSKVFDIARLGMFKLKSKPFLDNLVDRYLTVEFEKKSGETNPAVRNAMYFKRMAPKLTSWMQVLGDKPLFEVIRTALGLPGLGSQVGLDKQVKMLERRIGLENFKKEAFVDRFVSRYLAGYDAKTATGQLSVAALVQPIAPISSAGPATLSASTLFGLSI